MSFRTKTFLIEDAAEILMEHYSVSEETAKKDATVWVDALKKCGIISAD